MCYTFISYFLGKQKNIYSFHCFYKSKFRYLSTNKNTFANEKEKPIVSLQDGYHPKEVESGWYDWWESRSYFSPKPGSEPFVVLLPPPNVTGNLHLGHALTMSIQDVFLRWKRMKGESVLWIPGIDHAGIATQSVVERYLRQTHGLSKHDLGKEEFLKKVEEWKSEKGNCIIEQLRSMGASLDWKKLIYTMDSSHSELVADSFIRLYNDGLIYREKSFVNWSCALRSSVSDIEVDFMEIEKKTKVNVPGYEKPVVLGVMYDIAYKVCDEDEEIVVSTTRPETMLGDVAIAVHPECPVHSKFLTKQVWHPFRKEKIPVIGDLIVDPKLGRGAVKITPAHSPTDYSVGVRHNLGIIQVIDEEGLIMKVGTNEKFHGLKRFDARRAVVEELSRLGLFRGYAVHPTRVPVCSRSGDIIEPMFKSQWFLKCDALAQKAVEAVENGELRLEPKSYKNVWVHWLRNESVRDWNLSRQLWWGHQVPMYKCWVEGKEAWVPGHSQEEARSKAAEMFAAPADEVEVLRDPDVLDTWFSSGLLPLNPVFGRGRQPPISLMVTGHDILFFWVARMVMLSLHLTGKLPFNKVFLHSLVCDSKGQKMSKSLGNVVSPEEIMKGISLAEMKKKLEKELLDGRISSKNFENAVNLQQKMFPNGIPECGVDGLRFTLCSSYFKSSFVNFDINLCRSSRFFCNKIYQCMKYFIKTSEKYREMRSEFDLAELKAEKRHLNYFDQWILSRLAEVVRCVDEGFASCSFSGATKELRSFVVGDFCGNYLESSKTILTTNSALQYRMTISVLFHCLEISLRMLSPLMPYLTEHMYHALPPLNGFHRCESVTVAAFPDPADCSEFRDVHLEQQFAKITHLLTALRKMNTLLRLKEVKPNVFVKCPDRVADILFSDMSQVFRRLAAVGDMTRVDDLQRPNVMRLTVEEDCTALVEHPYDKTTLEKLLAGEISKEVSLKQNLEKLESALEASESEKPKSLDQQKVVKVNALKSELHRIEELKKAIEGCSS